MRNDCITKLDECLSHKPYQHFDTILRINTNVGRNVFRINGYDNIKNKLNTRNYNFKQLKLLPQHQLIILVVEEG